jgi:citrate synthase
MSHHLEGFPSNAQRMAILSAMINVLGCFEPQFMTADDDEHFMEQAARLMSKIRTIAAAIYRKSVGRAMNYPRSDLRYTANFLHMLFSNPFGLYDADPVIVDALDRLLILHADHEQNYSTSTVRMVASSQESLHASVAAGICALWGPLHGGANVTVMDMLDELIASGQSLEDFVAAVKQKNSKVKLMDFGHRVYKSFDPRAKIIKEACDRLLDKLGINDPMLDMAMRLEEVALNDSYFVERNLYPNIDYYSGIITRAIGNSTNMFTVVFAIGRLPGWISQWREVRTNPHARIERPRQIYVGEIERSYVPIAKRGL